MLKLVLLVWSLESVAGADTCDTNDLRYLFAKVHTMDKTIDNQIRNLNATVNTKLGEKNQRIDRLNSTIADVREELQNITKIIDGSWSIWGAWDTCSDSCGGGVKSRERTCNNPAPSPYGQFCLGRSSQAATCNRMPCSENVVAFTAYGLVANVGTELIFPNVWENRGNGYSTTTGRFTCFTSGIYSFSATLTKTYGSKIDQVRCYLSINDSLRTGSSVHLISTTDQNDEYCISISGTFHLNRNDFVKIGKCLGQEHLFTDTLTSFSGFLVTPDN